MILRTVYIDLSTAELLPQYDMSTRQSSGVHLDELTCLAIGKLEESRSVTSATEEVGIAHRVVLLFGGKKTGTAVRVFSSNPSSPPAAVRYLLLHPKKDSLQQWKELETFCTLLDHQDCILTWPGSCKKVAYLYEDQYGV